MVLCLPVPMLPPSRGSARKRVGLSACHVPYRVGTGSCGSWIVAEAFSHRGDEGGLCGARGQGPGQRGAWSSRSA